MCSLIRAFACHLNILQLLGYWPNIFGVSKLKRRLHRLIWVYTCSNATLLEITCHGSDVIFYSFSLTLECADEDGMRYRSVMSSLLQEYGGVGIYVKVMHKLIWKKHRLICTFVVHLQQQNVSYNWAYKWVYKRDSLCNGNWLINWKLLYLHTLYWLSLKGLFLGYVKIKLQLSSSISNLHKPFSR